jgi:hypothetical protein
VLNPEDLNLKIGLYHPQDQHHHEEYSDDPHFDLPKKLGVLVHNYRSNQMEDLGTEDMYETIMSEGSSFYGDGGKEVQAEVEEAFASLGMGEEYEYEKEGTYEVGGIIYEKRSWEDTQRTAGPFTGGGGGTLPPKFAAIRTFTKEERISSVFFHVVDGHKYFGDLNDDRRKLFLHYLENNIETLPGIMHMNVVTLALAALLLWSNRSTPTKSEVTMFLSDKPKISPVDFVRYLRFLQNSSQKKKSSQHPAS